MAKAAVCLGLIPEQEGCSQRLTRRETSDENTLEAEGLPQGPQWGLRGGGGTPGSHSGDLGEVEGPQGSHWGMMEPGSRPEAELEAESSGILLPLSCDLQGLSLSFRVHFPLEGAEGVGLGVYGC